MLDTARTFRTQLPIIGFDGKEIDNPSPETHKLAGNDPHATEIVEIRNAMDKVSRALGGDIDWQHFQWLLMYQNGITLNDGVGLFRMTVPEISRSADQIVESLRRSKRPLPVATDETRMMTLDDRYSMPLLSPDMAEYMFQFPTISQAYDTMAEFRNAMASEAMVAKQLVENIVANGTTSYRAHKARLKRDALFKFLDWTFHENGMPEVSGHVYGDEYVSDVISNETAFWSKIFGNPSMRSDREIMLAESRRTAQHISDLNKLRMSRTNEFESGDFSTTSILGSDAGTINGVLDFWTRVSQTMAIISPSVAFSNVVDKGIHTNLTFAALSMGRHGIGPYGTDVQVSQDAIKMFAEDPRVQKVFVAYRMAMIDGDVASLVNIVDNEQQLDAWLQQKAQRGGAFRRLSDLAFNLANGGNIFMNRQLRNFANYFFMIEHDAGHDWWFRSNPDGVMVAEAQLAGHNPQHFILDVLMGRNDNASFGNAQVAMNFALQGDMAQRNVVSMLYQEAVRRYGSSVKFLTSTFLSKFFVYRTNQIGRLLNTVMPMSSLNFVVTRWAATNTEIGRAIHVEDAQVFTQFKRAAMADAMHMAPHLLGIVLGSLTAFFIGRCVGHRAVAWMIGKDTLDKWLEKIKGKDKLLLSAMFLLPVFPDDILCFVAGLSSMSFVFFLVVILISRVIAIFTTCYSVTLIPFDTWWGITLWVVLFLAVCVLFFVLYKKADAIQAWLLQKLRRLPGKKEADAQERDGKPGDAPSSRDSVEIVPSRRQPSDEGGQGGKQP